MTLGSVTEKPGIYAWYYRATIPEKDIEILYRSIQASGLANGERTAQVVAFLKRTVLDYFQETPYAVSIQGKLKQSYSGEIDYVVPNLEGLATRLAEKRSRMTVLKEALETSVPLFAAPLYIGSSKNLRLRISQHASLIEKYRSTSDSSSIETDDAEEEMAGFAHQVAQRKMLPQGLVVTTLAFDCEEKEYLDIETLLNRLYFPLLGRN